MQQVIRTLIENRASVNHYDPDRPVTEDQIQELVRLATRAPSAYNFQNWRFIAVRSDEARARLKAVAHQQHKVVLAPVTFIITGLLQAHEGLASALRPTLAAGVIGPTVLAGWLQMAHDSHRGNPQLQRDEAIRSASLAAMTLMLAAEGMGLATCAISGFDAAGVSREFGLAEQEVPVMLITVGYPASGNWTQKPRKPVAEVLAMA